MNAMRAAALAAILTAHGATAAPPLDISNYQGAYACHAATHLSTPLRIDELADVVRTYRHANAIAKGHSWSRLYCPAPPDRQRASAAVLPSFEREVESRDRDARKSVAVSTLEMVTPKSVVEAGGVRVLSGNQDDDAAPRAVLDTSRRRVSVDAGVTMRSLLAFLAYGGQVPISSVIAATTTSNSATTTSATNTQEENGYEKQVAQGNRAKQQSPSSRSDGGGTLEVPVARQMASTVGAFFALIVQGLGVEPVSDDELVSVLADSEVDDNRDMGDMEVERQQEGQVFVDELTRRQQERVLRRLDLSPDDPFLAMTVGDDGNRDDGDDDDVDDTSRNPLLASSYTLASYPWFIDQSVGGAVAMDTHGSSIRHGSLSSQLSAITLMLANGTLLTLTAPGEEIPPSSAGFAKTALGIPSIVATSRDDLFRAAQASIGVLGIIVRLTFRVVPLAERPGRRQIEEARPASLAARVRSITGPISSGGYIGNEQLSFSDRRELAYRRANDALSKVPLNLRAEVLHDLEGAIVAWFVPERRVWWSRFIAEAEQHSRSASSKDTAETRQREADVVDYDGPTMPPRVPASARIVSNWGRPRPPYGNTFLLGRGEVQDEGGGINAGGRFGPAFWSAFFRESMRPLLSVRTNEDAMPHEIATAATASRAVGFASAELAVYAQYELAIPLPFAADCLDALTRTFEETIPTPRRRRWGNAPDEYVESTVSSAFRSPMLVRFLGGSDAPLSHARGLPSLMVNLEDWVSAVAARFDLERWRDANSVNATVRDIVEWSMASASDPFQWQPGIARVLDLLRGEPCWGTWHAGKAIPTPGPWRRRRDDISQPASLAQGTMDEELGVERACAFACAAMELDPTGVFRSGSAAQSKLALSGRALRSCACLK